MSWKIALLVAFITALVTAFATAFVADKVTGMHGVSDFEGKRGYAVVFLFIPAGFIGGFLLGLLGTKLVGAVEWTQFWRAIGLSALLGQVALFGIAGLSLLSIPRPPVKDGQELGIEVEVMVPLEVVAEDHRRPDGIRMSLYAGDKDNSTVPVDAAAFREEEGLLIVPAVARLQSRSSTRILSFHLGKAWLAYDFTLPPSPEPADQWSTPDDFRAAVRADADALPKGIRIRYRVIAMAKDS